MAYQYELVLFDLDGTLTDSGLGIMNSVQYALKKIGRGVENLEELKCFVGPPLAQQFAKFCGFSDEKGHQMVEFYREYYEGKGMLENAVYDGIPEVLEQLKMRESVWQLRHPSRRNMQGRLQSILRSRHILSLSEGQIWTEAVRKRQKSLSMC